MSKATEMARGDLEISAGVIEFPKRVELPIEIWRSMRTNYEAALAVVEAAVVEYAGGVVKECKLCHQRWNVGSPHNHWEGCPVAHFEEVAAPPEEHP